MCDPLQCNSFSFKFNLILQKLLERHVIVKQSTPHVCLFTSVNLVDNFFKKWQIYWK